MSRVNISVFDGISCHREKKEVVEYNIVYDWRIIMSAAENEKSLRNHFLSWECWSQIILKLFFRGNNISFTIDFFLF